MDIRFEGKNYPTNQKGIPNGSEMSFYEFLLWLQKEITITDEDAFDLPASHLEYGKINTHHGGDYQFGTEKLDGSWNAHKLTIDGNDSWMDIAA